MSRHRDWDVACKVYIGNLGNNASKYELEDAFSKYGPLKNVWVARNPPGFAFGKTTRKFRDNSRFISLILFAVEFEDSRDAEDSVRGLDGTRVCGVSHFSRPNPSYQATFKGFFGHSPKTQITQKSRWFLLPRPHDSNIDT